MSDSSSPSSHVYVVKLAVAGGGFTGRIEHLGSGRRHDFHDRQSLLECLEREASRRAPDGGATASGAHHVA